MTIDWWRRPIDAGWEQAAFVLVLLFGIAVRIPGVWIYGRFWAEEGSPFFARAWTLPWWEALVAPHANYLNLVGNAASLLAAHLTTLQTAPHVTTTIAVLIQCLPGVLVVTAREEWLPNRFVVLTALAVIVLAPVPEEVWANSANSHVHLMLCAAIILALQPRTGAAGVFHGSLLLLASLSGPGCWALVPLYTLRAAIERSPRRALQGLVLFVGVLIQLLFFSTLAERDLETSPGLIGAIVLAKHVLLPLLGHQLAAAPISELAAEVAGQRPLWPLILVASLFATALAISALQPKQAPLWLLLSSATLACAGYIGGVGPKIQLIDAVGAARHAFAPQVLIGLALLSWSVLNPKRLRIYSSVLLGWIVLLGGLNYIVPSSRDFVTGPAWRAEVARWRIDPAYRLQIWPSPWSVALPAR